MSDTNYRPSGELQGDTAAIPSRGTGTGTQGYNSEGKSITQDATNSMGTFDANSDPAENSMPPGGR